MIIDASVAFKWLVLEPDSDAAMALIEAGESLVAPTIIVAEVGNALTKRIRRRELDPAGVGQRLGRLPKLLTLIDDVPLIPRAFDLSIELHHNLYDCIYLAAAEVRDEPLVTADAAFAGKLTHDGLAGLVRVLSATRS